MEKQKERIAANEKILTNPNYQKDIEKIDTIVKVGKEKEKEKEKREKEEKEKTQKPSRQSEANKFAKKTIVAG